MSKAISVCQVPGKPGQVYYPLSLDDVPVPTPGPNQLLVRITAVALNHRDLFIRQNLYPGIKFGVPLLSDGCGTVIGVGSSTDISWKGKRVVINPATGWRASPMGPEGKFEILGGTNSQGTLSNYVTVDHSEVVEAPAHLNDLEAAALPLAGLTAWRAVMNKAEIANEAAGKKILITGIGGGVALMALAFATAAGAKVWVTSSSQDKIDLAKNLGAKGGVNYRQSGWEKTLLRMIGEGGSLDAIVDGAGGDIGEKGLKLLKEGGIIAMYGMTVGPKITYSMRHVLKNIEVRGSTMGSRKEFKDMVDFVRSNGIKPIVSHVVTGIENLDGINELFENMKSGSQFGKLVIDLSEPSKKLSKI